MSDCWARAAPNFFEIFSSDRPLHVNSKLLVEELLVYMYIHQGSPDITRSYQGFKLVLSKAVLSRKPKYHEVVSSFKLFYFQKRYVLEIQEVD
jgi:hypothetical protein